MAEAISRGQGRDFWKEVKYMHRSAKSLPSVIDNADNKKDIAALFHGKFKGLYNSIKRDKVDVDHLMARLDNRISAYTDKQAHLVSTDMVKRLAGKLKKNKQDGSLGLNSNCIIYGSDRLFVLLALYFSAMLCHGHTNQMLLLGTLCPLPKNNAVNNSDNYRAVVLCSCIAKLYDLVFIEKQKSCLSSDLLQFGFKAERSTSQCTLMLTGIVNKFVSNGSSVYTILLDMSKAFDKVDHLKLFDIMIERNFHPLHLRCLAYMYLKQKLRVKWDNTFSQYFGVTNGVKQGGVLSPLLFCIYIDGLMQMLRDSHRGCYMGPYFAGVLGYADDLVLMSPSITGLEQMLKICELFAEEHKLSFNPAKSQYIVFRQRNENCNTAIKFSGITLAELQSVNHLGNIIYRDLAKCDIDRLLAGFYRQYNLFRSKFGSIASFIQARLMQTYCSSFYGCVLAPLKQTKRLQVAWRKCLRQVWRIPYRAHCDILRCLSSSLCESHMFLARFGKFALAALNSKCDFVAYTSRCLTTLNCVFATNINNFLENVQMELDELRQLSGTALARVVKKICNSVCKEDINRSLASVLSEMCQARDNIAECGLSSIEISTIINELCIN